MEMLMKSGYESISLIVGAILAPIYVWIFLKNRRFKRDSRLFITGLVLLFFWFVIDRLIGSQIQNVDVETLGLEPTAELLVSLSLIAIVLGMAGLFTFGAGIVTLVAMNRLLGETKTNNILAFMEERTRGIRS